MKKILIAVMALQFCYTATYSQTPPPPITSGLVLHLDAKNGFIPGDPPNLTPIGTPICISPPSTAVTPTYAIWQDQSGMGNDVSTGDLVTWGNGQSVITCNNANPQLVVNAKNTNFDAIHFDGNDYMSTSPNVGVLAPANGLAATDNKTEMTMFVVRIGAPGYQGQAGDDRNGVMVSIADIHQNSFPGYTAPYPASTTTNVRDEFNLMRDWAANIVTLTAPGIGHSMAHKEHQCFQQLRNYRPVVLSTQLGTSYSDVEYYINGVKSTEPLIATPSAISSYSHQAVDRTITIGARQGEGYLALPGFHFSTPLEGYLFEILVYNRKLTDTEMDQVNDFLKCKYDIRYSTCNKPMELCPKVCWTSPSLDVNYIGKDANGNCIFECTANAQAMTGITNFAYEWIVPGMPNMLVHSNAPSDMQTFTVPLGSTTIGVRLLGINEGTDEELECCEHYMSRLLYCGDIDGYTDDYEKPGKPTTVKHISNIEGVGVYPNPTFDIINIKVPDDKKYEISVHDYTGKMLEHVTTVSKVTRLSFGDYAKGMYLIRVNDQTGAEVKVEKVMLR